MEGYFNTSFELLQFIEIIYITNKCSRYVICLSFVPFVRLLCVTFKQFLCPHPQEIGHMFT